jgi:predicted NUDIX family NTP pyrophosphohydrolase
MSKKSAGILLYRTTNGHLELFLIHPGGPLFVKKDLGVWSIPKGEFENEEPKDAALREFHEETGFTLNGDPVYLGEIKMKSGKIVYCWTKEGDANPNVLVSNLFELEWPPKSGKIQTFPEVDRGEWFTVPTAKIKIRTDQIPFIDWLLIKLNLSEKNKYGFLNKTEIT